MCRPQFPRPSVMAMAGRARVPLPAATKEAAAARTFILFHYILMSVSARVPILNHFLKLAVCGVRQARASSSWRPFVGGGTRMKSNIIIVVAGALSINIATTDHDIVTDEMTKGCIEVKMKSFRSNFAKGKGNSERAETAKGKVLSEPKQVNSASTGHWKEHADQGEAKENVDGVRKLTPKQRRQLAHRPSKGTAGSPLRVMMLMPKDVTEMILIDLIRMIMPIAFLRHAIAIVAIHTLLGRIEATGRSHRTAEKLGVEHIMIEAPWTIVVLNSATITMNILAVVNCQIVSVTAAVEKKALSFVTGGNTAPSR